MKQIDWNELKGDYEAIKKIDGIKTEEDVIKILSLVLDSVNKYATPYQMFLLLKGE